MHVGRLLPGAEMSPVSETIDRATGGEDRGGCKTRRSSASCPNKHTGFLIWAEDKNTNNHKQVVRQSNRHQQTRRKTDSDKRLPSPRRFFRVIVYTARIINNRVRGGRADEVYVAARWACYPQIAAGRRERIPAARQVSFAVRTAPCRVS